MRSITLFIIGLAVLNGCNRNENKSDAYGNFEAREIMVSAESQGSILQLNLDEGEKLKKDKLVGWIDTSIFQAKKEQLMAKKQAAVARLDNIESQVAVQEEQIENLKTEKTRIEKMLKDEAATEQQFDNINGKLKVARKQLQSIKTQKKSVFQEINVIDAQIKEINTNMDNCRIKNPIHGTVIEKYMEEGEFAGPGMAIYKIADLNKMDLRVYVTGAQLPHIKIGQQVEVLIDKNEKENQKLTGEIIWISDNAEFTPKIIQTKEERVDLVYAVKIRVKNDGSIKIGMPGEANF